jgi:hypothetical protein
MIVVYKSVYVNKIESTLIDGKAMSNDFKVREEQEV